MLQLRRNGPRLSIGADHGGPWKPSSSQRSDGWTGSTIAGPYRQHPAGRSRGTLLRHDGRNRRGSVTQTK
jgi:hypothetical protein